jgi:hypothetical protein
MIVTSSSLLKHQFAFLLLFVLLLAMSFRCDACSKTDIANDGALKRHFRACPAYNEQFSQLRTVGAKRKLDAAGLNGVTKSQPFKKRTYRPPLAARVSQICLLIHSTLINTAATRGKQCHWPGALAIGFC